MSEKKKSDGEIMDKYNAKVKALNLCWVSKPLEKIEYDTTKTLLNIIKEQEKDEVRDHIICMYQKSCEDLEISEPNSREASFYEGARNAYSEILFMIYGISYSYITDKPSNEGTFLSKKEILKLETKGGGLNEK